MTNQAPSPTRAWQMALDTLRMEMPKASFDTWVRDAELTAYNNGTFTIGVANAYAREWLDSRLTSTVNRILTGVINRRATVQFVVWEDDYSEELRGRQGDTFQDDAIISTTLNKDAASRWGKPEGLKNILEIKVPKGHKGIAYGEGTEAELILPRGTKFKVTGTGKRTVEKVTGERQEVEALILEIEEPAEIESEDKSIPEPIRNFKEIEITYKRE